MLKAVSAPEAEEVDTQKQALLRVRFEEQARWETHRDPYPVGRARLAITEQDGYTLVAEADQRGVSPGSDVLLDILEAAAPCVVLIDEWVAYVRALYGKADLPGGSFEANLTFAQTLTEAARAVPRTLVVASLPSSDIESGGEGESFRRVAGKGTTSAASRQPIHSSGTLQRLYTDWSSLDTFQHTRGVLRLMAAVIHTLWEHQDLGL